MSVKGRMIRLAKKWVAESHFPPELLRELRVELLLLLVRWVDRLSPKARVKRAELSKLRHVKLHLGCGPKIFEDWVNIDGFRFGRLDYQMDLRCRLPFSDDSTAMIFSDHLFEHLHHEKDVPFILKEFFRILEPGGWVRILTPSLEKYCTAYVSGDSKWFATVNPNQSPGCCAINNIFMNYFHKFIYDFGELSKCLSEAGFVNVKRMGFGESSIPELAMDNHQEERIAESICVEAQKPLLPVN